MYDHVLVPTDGSEHSLAAGRQAFELAETYGATVHALFVTDTETSLLAVSKSDVRSSLRELGAHAATEALAAIERLAEEYDVTLETAHREGAPDEEILAAVDENDIDLVVMGTHGRTGLGRRLVGSVTERVVRDAPTPVMTVTATDHNAETDPSDDEDRSHR